jgi:dUTP pyrophosphatase
MIVFKRIGNHTLSTPKNHDGAGIDLCATEDFLLYPNEVRALHLGFAVQVPHGWCSLLMPRSGLGSKGIVLANTIGLIDPSYRGELIAMLMNRSKDPYTIHAGDRVCQLLVVPYCMDECTEGELTETSRGAGGFGSTGK